MDDHAVSWNVVLLIGGVGYGAGALSAALLLGLLRALRALRLARRAAGGSVTARNLSTFMAAQVHYRSWFEGLGLEDWLNPAG